MIRRQLHIVGLETAGGNACDNLRTLHGHAAKQLGLKLHGGHGDVADVGLLDRDDGILAIHFHEPIIHIIDRTGVLLGAGEHAAYVALLPMRGAHFAIGAHQHHQV